MSQLFSKEQSPQRPLTPNAKHPLRRFLRKPFQIVPFAGIISDYLSARLRQRVDA